MIDEKLWKRNCSVEGDSIESIIKFLNQMGEELERTNLQELPKEERKYELVCYIRKEERLRK